MLIFRRFLAALIVLVLVAMTLSPLAPLGLVLFWVVLVPTKALDRLAKTGEHAGNFLDSLPEDEALDIIAKIKTDLAEIERKKREQGDEKKENRGMRKNDYFYSAGPQLSCLSASQSKTAWKYCRFFVDCH